MSKPKPLTLFHYLNKLNAEDRAIILRAVQFGGVYDYQVHMGHLPFLEVPKVYKCLENYTTADKPGKRRLYKIRQKLGMPVRAKFTFNMVLDPIKVLKQFGIRPQLGRRIGLKTQKVIAGREWNIGRKDYIDAAIDVQPVVALRCLKTNSQWEVHADPKYRREVEMWLIDHCR